MLCAILAWPSRFKRASGWCGRAFKCSPRISSCRPAMEKSAIKCLLSPVLSPCPRPWATSSTRSALRVRDAVGDTLVSKATCCRKWVSVPDIIRGLYEPFSLSATKFKILQFSTSAKWMMSAPISWRTAATAWILDDTLAASICGTGNGSLIPSKSHSTFQAARVSKPAGWAARGTLGISDHSGAVTIRTRGAPTYWVHRFPRIPKHPYMNFLVAFWVFLQISSLFGPGRCKVVGKLCNAFGQSTWFSVVGACLWRLWVLCCVTQWNFLQNKLQLPNKAVACCGHSAKSNP